jgi:hypothetical protein
MVSQASLFSSMLTTRTGARSESLFGGIFPSAIEYHALNLLRNGSSLYEGVLYGSLFAH